MAVLRIEIGIFFSKDFEYSLANDNLAIHSERRQVIELIFGKVRGNHKNKNALAFFDEFQNDSQKDVEQPKDFESVLVSY